MENNLNKPITVAKAEFVSNIVGLINESGLPPFIIELILKDIYIEIKNAAQKQYELDMEKYNQLIKSQNDMKVENGEKL